jgi:lauroyl/myristoyl acyltransferase
MSLMRSMRRGMTARAVRAGRATSAWMPMPLIDGLERLLAIAGPRLPFLARMVRANMQAAGVYSREAFVTYFEQIALHIANAARIFRLRRRTDAVQRLASAQIDLDRTIELLDRARQGGRGVLLAPAHTVNFVLTLARLNQDVPIHVFLRWSRDAHKVRMKREWCEAAGLQVILEPAGSLSATSRAAVCVDALRGGAVLAITPDVAQKSTEGAAVEAFGRQFYLPTGAAAIARLAECSILPMFGRLEGRRQVLHCRPPIVVDNLRREEGGRKESLRRVMQAWACGLEAFVRDCPAAWFMWGDSRWTRVFACDPKYATRLSESPGQDAGLLRETVEA